MDNKNNPIRCRCLLDSGSQSCFITSELANRLKLPLQKVDISIVATNAIDVAKINKSINATIKSTNSSFTADLPFLIIKNITDNVPQYTFANTQINIPNKITLADSDFNKSSRVDILLGCNIFYDLLLTNKIKLGEGMPTLQESYLGWLVAGSCNITSNSSLCFASILKTDIQDQLEKILGY